MSLNGGWSQPNQALSPESFNPMMLQKELMHAWEEEKPQPGMSVAELRRRFELGNDNQNATTRTPTRVQEEPQSRRQEYAQRRPVPAPREYATPEREEYRQQEYAQPKQYNYTQEQQYSQAPRYPQREYTQPERDTYHQKENIMPRPIARPASASPKQVDSPQSQIIVPSPKSVSARKKAINQQKEKVPRKQVRSIYNTIQQDLYQQQEYEQQRGPASSVPARQHAPEPTLSSTQRHSSWSGLLDDDQESYNRQSDNKVPPPPPRRKTPVGYAYQRPYSYHSSAHNEDPSLGFMKQPEEYRVEKKMRQEQPTERDDVEEVTQDAYADQIRKMMKRTPAQYSPIRPAKASTEKRLVGPSDEDIFRYAKSQEPLHVRRSPQAKLQSEGHYDPKYNKGQWGERPDTKASYERPQSATRESPQPVQNRYGSPADTGQRYGDDRARQSPITRSTSWNQQQVPEREQQDRSAVNMKKSITIDSLQPRGSFSESEPGESIGSLDDKVNSYLEMKGFKPKPQAETSEPVQRRPQRNRAKFTNRESYVYRDSTPSPQHSTQSYEPAQRSSPRPASIDFPPPPPEMLDFPPPPPLEYTTAEIVHSTHPTSVVSSTAYDRDDPPGKLNSNTTQTEERYEEPRRDRDFNRINLQLRQQTEERVNSYPSSDAEDEESSSNYSYEQSSPERRHLQKKYAGIPRSPVIDFKDFLENGEEQNSKADDIKFQRYPVREDEPKAMSREDSFVSSTSGSAIGFPLHRTEEVWSISPPEDPTSSEYQIFEAPTEPDTKQSPELRAPSERKMERKQVQKRPSMKDLQGRTQNVINRHSRENLSHVDGRRDVDVSGSSPTLTPSESGTETEDSPREWRRQLQQQDLAEREQKYWRQEEERLRRDEDERAAKVAAVKERRDSDKRAWLGEQERMERMQREYEERQRLEDDRRRLLDLKKREDQRKAEEEARQAEEQARREVEEKLRRQAEERERQEAEMKAQQEAEERAKWEAQERARREAEIKARMEAEERAKQEMEEARREAEERARREAELRARREAEERAQREAEERARREAEERARREARERAIREAEEEARREAEIRARIEAEERAHMEAKERARREAEERARKEAEERAQREAEERARREAEERALKEAEERARREAEERARWEAEERARWEAEERARREAEERARREAEERARQEVEERAHRQAEARREAQEQAFREAQEKKREEEQKARKEAEAAEIRARLEHEDRIRREVAAQAQQELEMAQKAADEQMRKEEELKAKLEADKQAEMEAKKMWEAAEQSVKEAEERARRASLNRQKKEQEAEQKISPQKISPPRERARSDTEEVSARKPPIPAPRRRNQSEAPDEQTTSLKRGAKDRMSLRELKEFTRGTILRLSSRSLASYASEPPPDLRSDVDLRSPDSGGGGRLRKKVPSLRDLKTQTRDQIIRHSRDSLSYRRSHSSLSSPGPFSGDDDDDDYYVPFNDYDSDEDNSLRQKVPPCMRPHRRKGPGSKSADPLQRRSFHEMPQDGLSSDMPPVRVTIPMRGAKSTEAIVQQKKKQNMTVEVTLVPRASIENLDKFKPEVKVTNNAMEYKKLTGSMPELSDDGSEKKAPSGLRGSRSKSDYGIGKGRGSKMTSGDTGYSSVTSDDSPDNVPSRPRTRSWKGSVSLDTEGMDDLLTEEKEAEKKEAKSPKSPKSPKSKSKKKSGTFPRFKQDQKQERPRSRVEILLHGIGNQDPKAPYYETEV
ncbi:uncharacterized protein LOC144928340 [Branchiostoma floridae x Branchiostoma belcheri]